MAVEYCQDIFQANFRDVGHDVPQYSDDNKNFNSSIAYGSVDYTWCVQRAKLLSLCVFYFRIATATAWLLVVGVGYMNGFILYLFVQFDSKPQIRFESHNLPNIIAILDWNFTKI